MEQAALEDAARGAGRDAPLLTPSPEEAAARQKLTAALQWMWDGVYQISAGAGGLEAWRTDASGSVRGGTPESLRDAIREDYPKYAAGTAL